MNLIRLFSILLLYTRFECKGITNNTESANSTNLIDPEAVSGRQAAYGLIKFEGQTEHEANRNGQVTFTEDRPLKVEDIGPSYSLQKEEISNYIGEEPTNNVVFEDDNNQNQKKGHKKRRKRRRKSRRYMNPFNGGNYNVNLPGVQPTLPAQASVPMPPGILRTLSEAFNSIVQNDDKKCVSRLLCEQGATGSLPGTANTANTIATILQYLPVLQKMISYSAYPLFDALGKLAFAMNSGQMFKNQTICEIKYPDCPSDPEERLYYFNNHKGGFSRFFRGESQHLYTPQEFHNNLLSMGLTPHPYLHQHSFPTIAPTMVKYGILQPGIQVGNQNQQPYTYGLNQNVGQYAVQSQRPLKHNFQNFNRQPYQTNNVLQHPNPGFVNPTQAAYSRYGPSYPYRRQLNTYDDNYHRNAEAGDNSKTEIQRRIQNKRTVFADEAVDNDTSSYKIKWSFPKLESAALNFNHFNNKEKKGKKLKFPDNEIQDGENSFTDPKGFLFPGAQSNRQYFNIFDENYPAEDSVIDSTSFDATGGLKVINEDDENNVRIVYIVRGNGDPRHPEIVKLRPGEKIH